MSITRRKFLRFLGIGTIATPVIAKTLPHTITAYTTNIGNNTTPALTTGSGNTAITSKELIKVLRPGVNKVYGKGYKI